ncbi:hypothetical protein ACJJTC_006935 [Scirpophaga incertulas]
MSINTPERTPLKPLEQRSTSEKQNINNNLGITAQKEKKINPLVIIKGVSKDIPREKIVDYIIEQNQELNFLTDNNNTQETLAIKFARNNRNPHLNNYVLSTSPNVWKTITQMGRVAIEYQKVHVEEFSNFVQCKKCAQFGHTHAKCPKQEDPCIHCWKTDHKQDTCPIIRQHQYVSTAATTTPDTKLKTTRSTQHSHKPAQS